MGNPALNALGFILGILFNLYATVVAVRFVMQVVQADYYNPSTSDRENNRSAPGAAETCSSQHQTIRHSVAAIVLQCLVPEADYFQVPQPGRCSRHWT